MNIPKQVKQITPVVYSNENALLGSTKTKKKYVPPNNKTNSKNNERNIKLLLEELDQIHPRYDENKQKHITSSPSFDIDQLFEPQQKRQSKLKKKQTKKTKSNKSGTRKKNIYKKYNKTPTTIRFPKIKQ